jgi:glycosyltransferase involved in cell wall biosynthesis
VTDCALITPARLARPAQLRTLFEMTASLCAQTSGSWHLVLIDDGSPLPEAPEAFARVRHELGDRVTVLHRKRNSGQGICRNIGAKWAWRESIPYCLYLDDDDIADSRRVATVRQIFRERPDAAFVYSSFALIDQHGRPVPEQLLAPSIREILESHEKVPPTGPDAWRKIAVDTGYTTLTSVVSVRTWLALACPFPDVYVSEDQHTWLRMCAATDGVVFDPDTLGRYRINIDGSGSSVRERIGANYYEQKAWVDTHGFIAAVWTAVRRNRATPAELPGLLSAYFRRCAATLAGENRRQAADEYRALAREASGGAGLDVLALIPQRPQLFRPS